MMKLLCSFFAAVLLSSCHTVPQLAQQHDPCQDSAYLALHAVGYDRMTPAQQNYYLQKESDCFTYRNGIATMEAEQDFTVHTMLYSLVFTALAIVLITQTDILK